MVSVLRSGQAHVRRVQVRHAGDAEERHRPAYLLGEDLRGAGHTALTAGHQAVQVRPADKAGVRAESDRGDDVGTGHDAGVEIDLGVAAHRLADVGKDTQRRGSAVQLATAVVREDDRVCAGVDYAAGVLDGLDTFDDQRSVPDRAQPVEVVDGHRRVEQLVQQLGDGAVPGGQRGERQRTGGEQVGPPGRVQRRVQHGLRGERRWNREAVADIAEPGPGNGYVDGQHQRLVPGGGRTLRQV